MNGNLLDLRSTWPALPYSEWRETCAALHIWSQIVGKYRLAHTPWVNHSWHATLYVTPRGLTTGPVPDGDKLITLAFDFCDHTLVGESAGARETISLDAMSVADFLDRMAVIVTSLGGHFDIHGTPNEMEDPVPFDQDKAVRGPMIGMPCNGSIKLWCASVGCFRVFALAFLARCRQYICSGVHSTLPSRDSQAGLRRCIQAVSRACPTR
jgi:hypothetical protein